MSALHAVSLAGPVAVPQLSFGRWFVESHRSDGSEFAPSLWCGYDTPARAYRVRDLLIRAGAASVTVTAVICTAEVFRPGVLQ